MREESLAAHAELKGRNLMKALIAGVCAVVLTGRVLVGSHGDSFFLAAFVFIGGIGFASWLSRVSKSEYYALPHATDGFGETRCIWCGNKGIWRKGQYKSNITHSHCSKCKERLFSS